MRKREILISYNWNSKNYGSGNGFYTRNWYGKLKQEDIYILVDTACESLKEKYKDTQEYFSIVILNIVYLK